ncbi:hypothetical protein BDV96DRAFT_578247 [Lophiotrema nucula]|uniref:Peptidase S8/S53 domain-containing protein n=1 Tax=Lophiotrema nucula TaxID=690887 RepID=A0A6A5Z2R6_9PLEO|nr:hypothetical protein BDV96DRAFT_578247 [Lophiotrema nucula]
MADKHLDDDFDGDYGEEYYSDESQPYNDDDDEEAEVFLFNEVSEYIEQLDLPDAKKKHQEIIAAAEELDLTKEDVKDEFILKYRPYFKQRAGQNFTIFHSLAQGLYDKSADFTRYIPLLKILLEDQPDLPNMKDAQNQTALHIVIEARQSDVGKYLIETVVCEPDWLGAQRKDDDTALHLALKAGLECSEYLIRRIAAKGRESADRILSTQGDKKQTPLHIAVDYSKCSGKQADLVKLLLEASDLALATENKDNLSPFRYHQSSQSTFRNQQAEQLRQLLEADLASAKEEEKNLSPFRSQQASQSTSRTQHSRNVKSKLTAPSTPDNASERGGGERSTTHRARPKPSPGGTRDGAASSSGNRTKAATTPASRQVPKRSVSDLPKQEVDPEVARKIQDLLLQHVLRTRSRDEAIRILHGPIQKRQIDFDLVPIRKNNIQADDLERYAGHLNFEPVLQYVAIPMLKVENFPTSKWKHEAFWESRGRKDYLAIFDWLYEKGVRHIVRVIVVDHDDRPHSDAVIIRALNRFGVERLDWKRFDLCSHAIINAVENVTQLKLYCNGNDAILRSWSSPTGLVNLKSLKKVEVDMYLGWETLQATKDAATAFEVELRKVWEAAWTEKSGRTKTIEVKCYVQNPIRTRKAVTLGDSEKKRDAQYEQRELWMDCMKEFATFIQNYEPLANQPVIKVALIDDGVDSTFDDLSSIIKEGQSYSIRDKELGLWNPYYHSADGHGTVMAWLIRLICPRVQIYVAKLNELQTQDKVEITASSAIKAINWAKEMGVHIMSMSWSIDKMSSSDARDLQKAVDDAIANNILLFCASDDQGNSRPDDQNSYPARCNIQRIFRIGAATRSGLAGEWVRGANFLLPGEKDQLMPNIGDQLSNHEPRTASSLATALGSGLAALILYCAALNGKEDFDALRTQEKMYGAFKNLCKSHQANNQYLHVREVFGKYKPKGGVGDDEETENQRAIKQIVEHLLRD